MRFKVYYLQEAPIAYDDSQEIGSIDKNSKTKWGNVPPNNMDYKELNNWVKEQIRNKVLKDTKQFSGLTKRAIVNDGKTMFKWVYDMKYGDQLTNEFKVYQRLYNKYKDLIPRFFKTGKHWAIQEYAKPITLPEFKKLTGINYLSFDRLISNVSLMISKFVKGTTKISDVSLNLMYDKMLEVSYFKPNKDDRQVITSSFFKTMLQFTRDSKTDLKDYKMHNMGIINNRIVLIDYGF